MRTQEVLQLDQDVITAWNKHDTEKFLALCDENIVWSDPSNTEPLRGKKRAREFFESWSRAFPDSKLTQTSLITNENELAMEVEFSGTHTGPLHLGSKEIPATRKKVRNKGSYFARVKDGKITELHSYPDTLGMMSQLGLVPQVASVN